MAAVTEAGDPSPHHVVQRPRKRTDQVQVSDFTMLVRAPGRPDAIRVFTDAEAQEADRYAVEIGGTVVPLPLSPPSGYTAGPDGTLLLSLPPTCAGMADIPAPGRHDVD